MYSIKGKQAARIEPVTFSELNMTENDIEEILRNSIDPELFIPLNVDNYFY